MSVSHKFIKNQKDNFSVLLDQASISASTFFASLFVARFSSQHDFGLFSIALSIIFFIGILHGSLITRPMSVIGNIIDRKERSQYFSSSVKLQIILIFLSVFFLIFILNLWGTINSLIDMLFIASVCLLCIGYQMREYQRFYYISRLQFMKAAKFSSYYLTILITITLTIIFFNQRINSYTMILILSIASLLPCIIISGHNNINGNAFYNSYKYAFSKNLPYSKWELFGSLCNYAYLGFITIIFGWKEEFIEAGGYTAARNLLGPLQILIFSTYNLIVPKATSMSNINQQGSINLLLKAGAIMMFFSCIVLVPILIFPAFFLEIIYGHEYKIFAGALQLFCTYYLFLCLSNTVFAFVLSRQAPFLKGIAQFIGMTASLFYIAINYSDLTAIRGAFATVIGESFVLISILSFALYIYYYNRPSVETIQN